MKKGYSSRWLVLVIALSLVGGFLGGHLAARQSFNGSATEDGDRVNRVVERQVYVEESQIVDTVRRISSSVVSIVITKDLPLYRQRVFDFNDFFGNDPFFNFNTPFTVPELDTDEDGNVKKERRKVGGGSGFIVSEDGLVVTNRHVVQDAEANYTIILNDQTEYSAEVLSRDTINDIALLRMVNEDGKPVTGLSAAPLGDSEKLQAGQRVIAIGNALAEYENTVTTGVISATGRSIQAGSINSTENLVNLIQTDAAINPGNSGGPLVNLAGEVIGINTAIAAQAQGIGFAIPINDVKNVIESVNEHGKIIRPFLGVRFMIMNQQKANELQID
ncbi:MAG: trypsin-like peptidase domain-containing protein, partial [Candidatus Peregrinibacteria bacterium]